MAMFMVVFKIMVRRKEKRTVVFARTMPGLEVMKPVPLRDSFLRTTEKVNHVRIKLYRDYNVHYIIDYKLQIMDKKYLHEAKGNVKLKFFRDSERAVYILYIGNHR
jgi:hypothetical protein